MLHCQLCLSRYAAFRIKNCSKSTSAIHAYRKRWCHVRPGYINDRLKSEVFIMLRCRLCSTCYTPVRIKNCLKSTSAIKIATMTNTDDFRSCFRYEEKPSRANAKSTLFAVTKMNGTQRRTLVVHEECIVRTAVCQKAPLEPKRR